MIERVAIVGAGTMGRGIAQLMAHCGLDVLLIDVEQSQLNGAQQAIDRAFARRVERGDLVEPDRKAALRRIHTSVSVERAHDAHLLLEAVTEDVRDKHSVFKQADEYLSPDAILASNTSSISITALAAAVRRPERVIGMHFFNPAPAMKLVEVVRGHLTDQATVETTFDLARRLGKEPVVVRDAPGFVSNRLLMPMINEGAWALMEGVADRDSIDTIVRLGMNHPMGPLQLADLIGLDVCVAIMDVLHRDFGDDKYRACPLLRRMVAAGLLGRKSGRGFYEYP